MREYSPNTQVPCDGKDCPYSSATLPGTRGRRGSYFGVEEVNLNNTIEEKNWKGEEDAKEKDLLEHLIASLGEPCEKVCALPGKKFPFASKKSDAVSGTPAAAIGGDVSACKSACRAEVGMM